MKHFLDLTALTQEGIDGARISLHPLLERKDLDADTRRALRVVEERLLEAELWLGRAIEIAATSADEEMPWRTPPRG